MSWDACPNCFAILHGEEHNCTPEPRPMREEEKFPLYCVVRVADGEVVGASTRGFMRALEDVYVCEDNWQVAQAIQPHRDRCIAQLFDQPPAQLDDFEANGYALMRIGRDAEPLPSPRAALPECVRVLVEREVKALQGDIAHYESMIRVHQAPRTWADEVHVQRTIAEHQSRLDMKRAELANLQRALAGGANG